MKSIRILFVLIIVVLSSTVHATSIQFNGTVNKIFTYDGNTIDYVNTSDMFGTSFSIGDTYQGLFDYNPDSSHLVIGNDQYSVYNHDTLIGIKTTWADYVFNSYGSTADYGFVQIQNNYQHGSIKDGFSVSDKYYNNGLTHDAELYLFDDSATVYNDLLLPLNVDLSQFNVSIFHQSFVDNNGNQLHIYGGIDSLSNINSAPVPEPTTFLLFGIGLLGTAWTMRKKQ